MVRAAGVVSEDAGGEGGGRCVMECSLRVGDDGYIQRCPSSARNIREYTSGVHGLCYIL